MHAAVGLPSRRIVSPLAEIMPDRCTPEYERILAKMGSLAAYGRAPAWWRKSSLLVIRLRSKRRTAEPFGLVHDWSSRLWPPSHWRPLHQLSHSWSPSMAPCEVHPQLSDTIVQGHVGLRNDQGEQRLFSSVPVEADRQRQQLSAVLGDIGATPTTALTVLSDGAEGPRFLGETASPGPTRHVLDCWYGRRPTASI